MACRFYNTPAPYQSLALYGALAASCCFSWYGSPTQSLAQELPSLAQKLKPIQRSTVQWQAPVLTKKTVPGNPVETDETVQQFIRSSEQAAVPATTNSVRMLVPEQPFRPLAAAQNSLSESQPNLPDAAAANNSFENSQSAYPAIQTSFQQLPEPDRTVRPEFFDQTENQSQIEFPAGTPIPDEQVTRFLNVAQMAANTQFMRSYSMLRIQDPAQLAAISKGGEGKSKKAKKRRSKKAKNPASTKQSKASK